MAASVWSDSGLTLYGSAAADPLHVPGAHGLRMILRSRWIPMTNVTDRLYRTTPVGVPGCPLLTESVTSPSCGMTARCSTSRPKATAWTTCTRARGIHYSGRQATRTLPASDLVRPIPVQPCRRPCLVASGIPVHGPWRPDMRRPRRSGRYFRWPLARDGTLKSA